MAFPTLTDIINSVVFLLVIGVVIVYLLSKALKLRPKPITIAEPKKEMTQVFLVIVAAFVVMSALMPSGFMLDVLKPADVIDVLWFVFFYALLLLPLVVAIKRTGQGLGSLGISAENGWRMVALGLILSTVYSVLLGLSAPSYGGGFKDFSLLLAYGLVAYAIVGFGEETVWRGYIQTRLVAYSGTLKGLVATSLLFALWHFPACYYAFSGAVLESLAYALVRFPGGLLFGYIMLKSQNIIPTSIFHALWNWSLLLWQLPTGYD